jgi:hypothetical protein
MSNIFEGSDDDDEEFATILHEFNQSARRATAAAAAQTNSGTQPRFASPSPGASKKPQSQPEDREIGFDSDDDDEFHKLLDKYHKTAADSAGIKSPSSAVAAASPISKPYNVEPASQIHEYREVYDTREPSNDHSGRKDQSDLHVVDKHELRSSNTGDGDAEAVGTRPAAQTHDPAHSAGWHDVEIAISDDDEDKPGASRQLSAPVNVEVASKMGTAGQLPLKQEVTLDKAGTLTGKHTSKVGDETEFNRKAIGSEAAHHQASISEERAKPEGGTKEIPADGVRAPITSRVNESVTETRMEIKTVDVAEVSRADIVDNGSIDAPVEQRQRTSSGNHMHPKERTSVTSVDGAEGDDSLFIEDKSDGLVENHVSRETRPRETTKVSVETSKSPSCSDGGSKVVPAEQLMIEEETALKKQVTQNSNSRETETVIDADVNKPLGTELTSDSVAEKLTGFVTRPGESRVGSAEVSTPLTSVVGELGGVPVEPQSGMESPQQQGIISGRKTELEDDARNGGITVSVETAGQDERPLQIESAKVGISTVSNRDEISLVCNEKASPTQALKTFGDHAQDHPVSLENEEPVGVEMKVGREEDSPDRSLKGSDDNNDTIEMVNIGKVTSEPELDDKVASMDESREWIDPECALDETFVVSAGAPNDAPSTLAKEVMHQLELQRRLGEQQAEYMRVQQEQQHLLELQQLEFQMQMQRQQQLNEEQIRAQQTELRELQRKQKEDLERQLLEAKLNHEQTLVRETDRLKREAETQKEKELGKQKLQVKVSDTVPASPVPLSPQSVAPSTPIRKGTKAESVRSSSPIKQAIDYENLGDNYLSSDWVPPSIEKVKEYQEDRVYRAGTAALNSVKVTNAPDLGVGVCLYFQFLKTLAYYFFFASILSLPSIIIAYNGSRIGATDQDAMGLYRFTLGNMGYDPNSPTYVVDSTCRSSSLASGNGTCIHIPIMGMSSELEVSTRDVAYLITGLEMLQVILFLLFLRSLSKRAQTIEAKLAGTVVKLSDYTVQVSNLPAATTFTSTELMEHFSNLYQLQVLDWRQRPPIAYCQPAETLFHSMQDSWIAQGTIYKRIGKMIYSFKQKSDLIDRIKRTRAQIKMFSEGSTYKQGKGANPKKCSKLKDSLEKDLHKMQSLTRAMAGRITTSKGKVGSVQPELLLDSPINLKDSKGSPQHYAKDLEIGQVHHDPLEMINAPPVCAFVTFEYCESFARCIEDFERYSSFPWSLCYPQAMKFKGRKLKVKKAPEPDEIVWENIEIGSLTRAFYRINTGIVSFILLLIVFIALLQTTIYKNRLKNKIPNLALCNTQIPITFSNSSDADVISNLQLARPIVDTDVLDEQCDSYLPGSFYAIYTHEGDFDRPVRVISKHFALVTNNGDNFNRLPYIRSTTATSPSVPLHQKPATARV